jgi:nitrile hydratase subunit beta
MNGAQDMGGKHGFGPVKPEPNEPVFHAEWEKRAFALTLAMGMPGGWNIDMGRFARENRAPSEYLSMSYYQIWFAALEQMIKERGLVSDDEIDAGLQPAAAEARQARALAGRCRKDTASRRTHRARDQYARGIQPW